MTDDLVTLDGQRVPYAWAERVAICLESGIPLEQARRTADEQMRSDEQRQGKLFGGK